MSRKRKNSSVQLKNLENTSARSGHDSSRSEKKGRSPELKDEIHSSPYLLSISQISQRERVSIESFLDSVIRNPGLIGVIKTAPESKSRLLPVAFVEGYSEPLIVRLLEISKNIESGIEGALNSQKITYDLEVNSIQAAKGSYILKRTYVPLTLDDVLVSNLPVKLDSILVTLTRLFFLSARLYKNSLFHGHIHPGNIVFGGSHDGHLIDYHISLLERPNRDPDTSFAPEFMGAMPSFMFDSYGLGYTLNRVLNEVRVHPGRDIPHIETLQSSFSPLISALMNRIPEKRPNADLARLMFLDIIPMIYPDFKLPEMVTHVFASDKPSPDDETEASHEDVEEVVKDDVKASLSDSDDNEPVKFENVFETDLHDDSGDDQDMFHHKYEEPFESQSHKKSSGIPFMGNMLFLILLGVLAFLIYKARDNFIAVYDNFTKNSDAQTYEVGETFNGPYLGYDKLRAAWASQVPSRMKLVARQAVHVSPHREIAEQVILSSLSQDEVSSSLVDTRLLRVAFHDQWEDQLDETDRRYALSLGLIGILKEVLPPGLGNIEDRHPTILLSILSSGNEKVYSVLHNVPAGKLNQLPAPYGTAFQILASGKDELRCSDEEITGLARFSTRGLESAREVQKFLSKDFQRRISAFSVIYSLNNDSSRQLLDIILYHPNFAVSNEYTEWGRKVNLEKWQDIDPVDQLFLLAGVPIKNGGLLNTTEITDLFMHPAAEIRKFAIQLSLDKIEFKHPAAMDVLQYIQNDPEVVTPEQLVSLLAMLVDPDKAVLEKREIVMSFINSDPDISICKKMLLGTSDTTKASPLDAIFTMYLVKSNWNPDPSELLILSEHTDKVARMFSYKKLFELDDSEHAILLLKGALEKEQVPEYRNQLKELIKTLSG